MCPQNLDAPSGNQRIRVSGAHDDTADPGLQHRIGTGWLLPVMAAGFEGHVHGGTCRILRAGAKRVPLRVELTVAFMPALSDDAAVLHDHRTHHRIRRSPALATRRQLKRETHIIDIVHLSPPEN